VAKAFNDGFTVGADGASTEPEHAAGARSLRRLRSWSRRHRTASVAPHAIEADDRRWLRLGRTRRALVLLPRRLRRGE
jgi:hypothetical protein